MAGRSCTTTPTVIRASLRLLALALLIAGCAEKGPERVALVGATILDGSGRTPLRNGVILVRGTHIEAIGPQGGVSLPRGTRQVDVSGAFIIPGLVDAHAHVARWALTRYLAFGVTTVRDVHGTMDSALALAQQADLNAMPSPRIFTAGAMIDGVPATYPDAQAVTTTTEARRAVDRLSVAGTNLVKVYTRITPPLLEAIVDEARTFQLPVAAHLGLTDAATAAKLGVRSIEHLTGIPEAAGLAKPLMAAHQKGFFAGWTAFERSWATLDSATITRVAQQLATTQVTMVPTLALHEIFSRLDDSTLQQNPDLQAMPPALKAAWNVPDMIRRAGWTAEDFAAFRKSRPNQDLFLRAFHAAGGRIVTGTDAANQMLVPGASEHTELELMVRAGLSPTDALRAATRDAALLLGADSLGVLAVGKVADIVVLARDPLADIRNTRSVTRVMVRGQLFSADSIRATW
jgi:imidazolonepropionase-like amidohydrolase